MEENENKGNALLTVLGVIVGVFTIGAIGYGFVSYEDPNSGSYPEPTYSQHCCVYCSAGQACGDTCIEQDDVCHVGRGCACD